MNHQYKVVLVLLLIALSNSCESGLHHEEFVRDGNLIRFSTDLLQTRAHPFTEEGDNDYTTMGVYSSITNGEWNFSDLINAQWTNQLLTREKGDNGWSYSPAKAWTNNRHSFFAYAPHNALGLVVTAHSGIPSMQFVVQDAPASQVDLLVAEASYNRTDTTTGAIHLRMHHALTRVLFSAKIANSVGANTQIKITKIELTHLHNRGVCAMDAQPLFGWNSLTGDKTYTLINNGIQLTSDPLTQELLPLTLEEGNLYLLPQAFTSASSAELKVTYETFENGFSSEVKTITTMMNDILDEWLPGEAIRFVLTIPNPTLPGVFSVDVEHIPWDKVEIGATIDADPYLDISNVSVSTYDASASRIYYYTNVPADSVAIMPIGNVSTKNGYPFALRDEFYALVADDNDGSFNFHAPVGGKGHIDLINRNTTVVGSRPNQGKNQLIIRLRAGKLVRDITVQPVVTAEAAKLNTTPYVGTFHRQNETGERIVTWHLPPTVAWEASIVDESLSNHTELCIDRLSSPDYANNILYTLSPRDAEGTKVDPTLRSVKGVGRIYFRVGWKSPVINGVNRYARIEVRVAGGATHYIYCRQGENEERITNLANTLFAVYNTSQPREMVHYPSQVGMLYQWNRTKPWDPLGGNTPPGFPNDYDASFSYERSACPEGYLYPTSTELGEMKQIIDNQLFRWGYYADGFFDRRAVTLGQHRVESNTLSVASAGFLFFPPAMAGLAPRSIFLTTGGERASNGELHHQGLRGGYWTDVTATDVSLAQIGYFQSDGATDYTGTSVDGVHTKNHAHSIRCVLPPVGTAYIVRFDANGGENAPASITFPKSIGKIAIPSVEPNDYWREGYFFIGWNSDKAGTASVTYKPGDDYTPSATNPSVNTLYAKWVKDSAVTTDYRLYSAASRYIMAGVPTSYMHYTLASNGNPQSTLSNLEANEKAYPVLKWGDPVTSLMSWGTAYSYCKDSYKGMDAAPGAWRLPRALEVYLVSNSSPVAELKGMFGNLLWSGTVASSSNSWANVFGFTSFSKNESLNVRCVKEVAPLP